MNIILRNLPLTFDLESETPFFQVSIPHRIRFDANMISKPVVTAIVNQLFDTPDTTHCSFLSKYLYPIHVREKTHVGRFFNIINWREDVHVGEDTYTISTFYKITNEALIDYLLYVPRSFINPYIIFYNNQHIVYISSDVLDVISCSEEVIKNYKAKYADIMDTYYE